MLRAHAAAIMQTRILAAQTSNQGETYLWSPAVPVNVHQSLKAAGKHFCLAGSVEVVSKVGGEILTIQ